MIDPERPELEVFEWGAIDLANFDVNSSRFIDFGVPRKQRRMVDEDHQVETLLVKLRLLEERLPSDAVPIIRERVAAVARPITAARMRANRFEDRILLAVVPVALVTTLVVPPAAVGSWTGARHPWWLWLILGVAEFATVGFGLVGLIPEGPWRFAKRLAATVAFGAALVAIYLVATQHRQAAPSLYVELGAGVIVAIVVITAFMVALTLVFSVVERTTQTGDAAEALLVDLVSLAHRAAQWQEDSNFQQQLLRDLDAAARRAELAFPRWRPEMTGHLRTWASDRGRKVAAVLRKHQERVIDLTDGARSEVTDSLLNGVMYAARSDWASLLTVEPEPRVRSAMRWMAPRLILAGVLIAAAFALPALLPELIGNPTSFQATVLITAAVTLIAPDPHKAADSLKSFNR